jgi:PPM family protein phosphatase
MPRIRAAGLTHRGAVRTSNEDCIAIDSWITQRTMASPSFLETELDGAVVCLVADGMGGHAAGEIASLLAARDLAEKSREIDDVDQLEAALTALNQAIFDAMMDDRDLLGMGTTIAGVILREGEALVFNIGDSRVYVENAGFLRLLSTDDSSAAGRIGSHERTGQISHTLTQCLGGARAFEAISPHVTKLALRRDADGQQRNFDARFLLCSDGLTDMLDQDAIEACLASDPVETADNLFKAAMAEGGEDNISIVVADYSVTDSGRSRERPDPLPDVGRMSATSARQRILRGTRAIDPIKAPTPPRETNDE